MKPEIDYARLGRLGAGMESEQFDALLAYASELADQAYEAGRQDVLTDGQARAALLDGQSYWLDAAENADGPVGKVVAETVASAFREWADRYRTRERSSLDCPEDVSLTVVDG